MLKPACLEFSVQSRICIEMLAALIRCRALMYPLMNGVVPGGAGEASWLMMVSCRLRQYDVLHSPHQS